MGSSDYLDNTPLPYDLHEIDRNYATYRRRIQRWETVMPGAMHHVGYKRPADQSGGSDTQALGILRPRLGGRVPRLPSKPAASTTPVAPPDLQFLDLEMKALRPAARGPSRRDHRGRLLYVSHALARRSTYAVSPAPCALLLWALFLMTYIRYYRIIVIM
jgi:hypothetical protein